MQEVFSLCGRGVVCADVEVDKHGLNLCSSITGGGRKVKERRKEVKTDLCGFLARGT